MNRRGLFKMFGGAIAAAMLPLGALALVTPKPKRFEGYVDVNIERGMSPADFLDHSLADFRDRILAPAAQRMAEQLDIEMMRNLTWLNK